MGGLRRGISGKNNEIIVSGREIKINQYLFLINGSQKFFTTALYDLKRFSIFSRLKLNNKKTEVLWISSCTGGEVTSKELEIG